MMAEIARCLSAPVEVTGAYFNQFFPGLIDEVLLFNRGLPSYGRHTNPLHTQALIDAKRSA
jgi:hypothetical protein